MSEITEEAVAPIPNPRATPGARLSPVNDALAFLRSNRDTHTRWAEYFEQNPKIETEYLATGVWEGAADQRRLERQYNAAIATFEQLAAMRAASPDQTNGLLREALEEARVALKLSRSAIQDAFGQADAEARDHVKSAAKYDAGVRAFNDRRDAAIAKIGAALASTPTARIEESETPDERRDR